MCRFFFLSCVSCVGGAASFFSFSALIVEAQAGKVSCLAQDADIITTRYMHVCTELHIWTWTSPRKSINSRSLNTTSNSLFAWQHATASRCADILDKTHPTVPFMLCTTTMPAQQGLHDAKDVSNTQITNLVHAPCTRHLEGAFFDMLNSDKIQTAYQLKKRPSRLASIQPSTAAISTHP